MSTVRRILIITAAAGLLAAAAATPALAYPDQSPSRVSFTDVELGKARATVNSRLVKAPAGVTSWGVDPATNRMTVDVVAGDASALRQARAAVKGVPAAKIRMVTERPRLFYDVVGGQAIYTGSGRCSVGFSARNASGVRFVITAGHCTELGGTWSGYNRVTIGPVATTNFPTDDFGTIRVSNTAWLSTSKVSAAGGQQVRMTGSVEAAVGASTCRSGSTTGYRCGVIQAKNQTVNYGGGDIVNGLTRTNACAEPGDSGGSYFSGTQAQGIVSGGSGNCSSGGTTYFQPINEVLSRNALTLVIN